MEIGPGELAEKLFLPRFRLIYDLPKHSMIITNPVSRRPSTLILGAGFLGSALFSRLHEKGLPVSIFSKSNKPLPREKFFQGTLESLDKNLSVLDDVDTIVHTIHTTVPVTSMEDIQQDIFSNLNATVGLLELMRQRKIPRLFFLSSGGAVYGPNHGSALKENHPTMPVSSYGATKLAIEKYIEVYRHNFGLNAIIIRPSNVYGPGQPLTKPQGLIGHLAEALMKGKEISIWGDGHARKDFLFLDDFLSGMEKLLSFPGSVPPVLNLSSGKSFSILDLMGMMESISGLKFSAKFIPARPFDVINFELDHALFSGLLGWKPSVSIEEGLRMVLKTGH